MSPLIWAIVESRRSERLRIGQRATYVISFGELGLPGDAGSGQSVVDFDVPIKSVAVPARARPT